MAVTISSVDASSWWSGTAASPRIAPIQVEVPGLQRAVGSQGACKLCEGDTELWHVHLLDDREAIDVGPRHTSETGKRGTVGETVVVDHECGDGIRQSIRHVRGRRDEQRAGSDQDDDDRPREDSVRDRDRDPRDGRQRRGEIRRDEVSVPEQDEEERGEDDPVQRVLQVGPSLPTKDR